MNKTPWYNKVFDYIKAVANPSNGSAEAKLFIALTSFFFLLLAACVDLFTAKRLSPSEFIFYTITGLVFACLGLGTISQMKAMDIKGTVASDIVKEESAKENIDGAREVLESDKPKG